MNSSSAIVASVGAASLLLGGSCASFLSPSPPPPPPRLQTHPVAMVALEGQGTLLASTDGSFVLAGGESLPTPFSSTECPMALNATLPGVVPAGGAVLGGGPARSGGATWKPAASNFDEALAAGAKPVWVVTPDLPTPLYGVLLFCPAPDGTSEAAARAHLVRIPRSYVDATDGGRTSVVYEPYTAPVESRFCADTCPEGSGWLNNGIGAPGGGIELVRNGVCDETKYCGAGTDCADCGPIVRTTVGERIGWALYLSRMPVPGASFGAPPAKVLEALAAGAGAKIPAGDDPGPSAPVGGLGVALRKEGSTLVVIEVDPKGAAATVGIGPGDIIESIAGRAVTDLALETATGLLRGGVGTTVTIRVRRLVSGAHETVQVVRRALSAL